MSHHSEPVDVLRWYTRARRIPRLVGKLPGSERGLPGGPYTITQIIGGGIGFGVTSKIAPVVLGPSLLPNLATELVVAAALVIALRFVKPGGRDPVSSGSALLRTYSGPRWGRHRGKSLRPRRPSPVRGAAIFSLGPLPVPGELDPLLAVPPQTGLDPRHLQQTGEPDPRRAVTPPRAQPTTKSATATRPVPHDPEVLVPARPAPRGAVTALDRLLSSKEA